MSKKMSNIAILFLVALIFFVFFMIQRVNEFTTACTAAGGYPVTGRDVNLCLNPDSLIKVN